MYKSKTIIDSDREIITGFDMTSYEAMTINYL